MNKTCLALSSVLSLALLACGEDSGPDCASVTEAVTLTVGTGVSSYEPLAEGGTLEMIYGPQGGFHVHGSLKTTGFYPGDSKEISVFESGGSDAFTNSPTASWTVRSSDKQLGSKSWKYPLPGNDRSGDVVVLDNISSREEGLALEGTTGSIAVTLADECGVEQSTSVDVVFTVILPAE